MHTKREPVEAYKKMFAPAFERNYFFIEQPALFNFAVAANSNNFFTCELLNLTSSFSKTMDGPSGMISFLWLSIHLSGKLF